MNFVYVALGGALGAVKRGESYDPDRGIHKRFSGRSKKGIW